MRVDAPTRYDYRWGWLVRADGRCDLARVTILAVEQRRRILYLASLGRYEKGHVANGAGFRDALARMIHGATCATADAAAHRVLDETCAADVDYDRRTRRRQANGSVLLRSERQDPQDR